MRPALRWLSLVGALLGCSGPGALEAPGAATQAALVEVSPPPAASDVGEPAAPRASPSSAPEAANNAPRASRVELTFVGDIVFGGHFRGTWYPVDVPGEDPLAEVSGLLASDLAVGNLETTLLEELPKDAGDRLFAATSDQAAVLVRHGLRALSIANNHIHDFGAEGLMKTPSLLAGVGARALGAPQAEGSPFRVETVNVKDWRVGFIAATARLNIPQRRDAAVTVPFARDEKLVPALVPLIREARASHDLVIVVAHCGEEYESEPRPWQVDAAHAFIDAGADAVVAHHPHVLQPIERYQDGIIAYSLGNFVFPNVRATSRDTGVLRLGFSRAEPERERSAAAPAGACLDHAEFSPAMMRRHKKHYAPEPLTGKAAEKLLRRLARASSRAPHATDWTLDGDRMVTRAACAP